MSTNTQKALAAASALLLGVPTAALAHTNSIGYVGASGGTVTFWYGSWHAGTTFTEGSMTLQGVNGTAFTPTTVNWTLLQNTTPDGLISGTNYFQSDGTNLIPYGDPARLYGMDSYTWQGVTFTSLSAGDYQFTYNPIAQPTMDWDPSSQVIRTGTVTLSAGLLSGDANLNGILDIYETGGTPPPAPTVVSTAAGANIVTTSTTAGTRTVTNNPHRHIMGTDANGNQTETHYTDTEVITIPTTTTVTTTTPTTVTTMSDGSTTTTNGTPVVTTVTTDDNAGTSVITQATVSDWVRTRTFSVVPVSTVNHTASESGGRQKINAHTTTTTTTTPVYTRVFTNGAATQVTFGAATVEIADTYQDFYGRVDQHEVMDKMGESLQGLLNHEPTKSKEKVRVFSKNYYAWSQGENGYSGTSFIYGGGVEIDIKPTWTIGGQYNNVTLNLNGSDSTSKLMKGHYGVFNMFRGNTLSLLTNAGLAQNNYNVSRNVAGVFSNDSQTSGQEWWVSNRLFIHAHKNITPFVGHTVRNYKRNAFTETGSSQSARTVEGVNETYNVGEAGLRLETRFGGKKKNLFGVSVEGSYATDNAIEASATLDYKEIVSIQGVHQINNGVSNTAVSANVKFRF
jgi:hypothetical protein